MQKHLRHPQPNSGQLHDEVQPLGELLAVYQKSHQGDTEPGVGEATCLCRRE